MTKLWLVSLSIILCPLATLKVIFHIQHRKTAIYCFNFRFLIFCPECDKVFVNELTQDEVDELEIFK